MLQKMDAGSHPKSSAPTGAVSLNAALVASGSDCNMRSPRSEASTNPIQKTDTPPEKQSIRPRNRSDLPER